MPAADMKRLIEVVRDGGTGIPSIANVIVSNDGIELVQFHEGQWISGRIDRNIRLDQATHLQGAGQAHAHVHGRKGDELVVVNLDGSASHGAKGRLHPDDADALVARGYQVPANRIVEWWTLNLPIQILLS